MKSLRVLAAAAPLLALLAALAVPDALRAQGYCTPAYAYNCTSGDDIHDFSLAGAGTGIVQSATGCSPGNYADYTAADTVAFYQGQSYAGSVTSNYGGQYAYIWIDLDDDSLFSSAEIAAAFGPFGGTSTPFTVTMPAGADTGVHRMRVRGVWANSDSLDPCSSYGYGETHDYTVRILTTPPCSGTPALAGVSASDSAVCAAQPLLLSLDSIPVLAGLSYQWQARPVGGVFADLAGAAAPSATTLQSIASEYRLIATCTASGGADTSAVLAVAQNSTAACYCSPVTGNALHSWLSGPIDSLLIFPGGIAAGTGAGSGTGYAQIAPGAGTTGTYDRLTPYTITARYTDPLDPPGAAAIWVDANADGLFDTAEYMPLTVGPVAATGVLYLPAGAAGGPVGLRLRTAAYAGSLGAADACTEVGGGETEDYLIDIGGAPACPAPFPLSALSTGTAALLRWAETGSAAAWRVEWGTAGFAPGSGTVVTPAGRAHLLAGLAPGTVYEFYVRSLCSVSDSSVASGPYAFSTTILANDQAFAAVPVSVGSGCVGTNPYTNTGGTASPGEPAASCATSGGTYSVWYKFTVPLSGAVRITTDQPLFGTFTDSRIALFSATDSADYSTFSILACDEDNGVHGSGYLSTMAATDLVPGARYYVLVDSWSDWDSGSFCLRVEELADSMLTEPGSCSGFQSPSVSNNYTGWVTMLDNDGRLALLVRDPAGVAYNYAPQGSTVNDTGIRREGPGSTGPFYLDRNWALLEGAIFTPSILGLGGPPVLPLDVRVFFTAADVAALAGALPGTALGTLRVQQQSSAFCEPNFDSSFGTVNMLMTTTSGTTGTAHWIGFTTPEWGNFYLTSEPGPLAAGALSIRAGAAGVRNRIDWNYTGTGPAHFALERSTDGRNFSTLMTLPELRAGSAPQPVYDEAPAAGTCWYRITGSLADGGLLVSAVARVTRAEAYATGLQVAPNPTRGTVTIRTGAAPGSPGRLMLTDATGAVLRDGATTGEVVWDLAALPAGVYLLRYSDAQRSEAAKLIKQ